MAAHFNWVDYTIIAIFIISILSGLLRGGVKEIISLLTWIAAFFVGTLFSGPLAAYFSNSHTAQSALTSASSGSGMDVASSQASLFAVGASFCILFFGTILIGAVIGYIMNAAVESTGVSIVNRLAGGIFGLGRGYLINLVIIFLVQLTPMSEQSFWTESVLVRSYQPAVTWLGDRVQPGLESIKSRVGQSLENFGTGVQNQGMSYFQKDDQ